MERTASSAVGEESQRMNAHESARGGDAAVYPQQQQQQLQQSQLDPRLAQAQFLASQPLQQTQQTFVGVPQQFPVASQGFPQLFGTQTTPTTHNLIPPHLFQQQQLLQQQQQQQVQVQLGGLHLNGTPGHPPALIASNQPSFLPAIAPPMLPAAAYTVQDRPTIPPVFNGINPNYPGLRVLHTQPPIFCVDNFLSPFECEFLIQSAQDSFGPAPVVGKGAGEVSASRTSSTCYLAREDLPDIMRKVSLLTGKPPGHCELPQVGRYFPSQQYLQHYDAFDTSTEDGRRFASNGGQRTVTCLIYLNTVHRGGATRFPALQLQVQPVQGMALVFFPATVDGLLDKMALHTALPAIDTKYVSQIWIRQGDYNGVPSKRLPQTLGGPHPAQMVPTPF